MLAEVDRSETHWTHVASRKHGNAANVRKRRSKGPCENCRGLRMRYFTLRALLSRAKKSHTQGAHVHGTGALTRRQSNSRRTCGVELKVFFHGTS
eukprot:1204791-Pleurochrysis_carterae.AAC.1